MMLSVTDTATEVLLRALDEAEGDAVFRLFISHEGYAMTLDSPSDEDRVIESEDRVVLAVAPEADEKLSRAVLDADGESEEISSLTLRPVG